MSKHEAIIMQMIINMVKIVWKYLSNIVQVLEKVKVCKYWADIRKIWADNVQIFDKWCPNIE